MGVQQEPPEIDQDYPQGNIKYDRAYFTAFLFQSVSPPSPNAVIKQQKTGAYQKKESLTWPFTVAELA